MVRVYLTSFNREFKSIEESFDDKNNQLSTHFGSLFALAQSLHFSVLHSVNDYVRHEFLSGQRDQSNT